MTDTDNSGKKDALKLSSPNTLSLTKTLEAGKVKQNFQRGRSKTVTVEIKKTRTFARASDGMVEVDRGASEATKQRMLNQAEREARRAAAKAALTRIEAFAGTEKLTDEAVGAVTAAYHERLHHLGQSALGQAGLFGIWVKWLHGHFETRRRKALQDGEIGIGRRCHECHCRERYLKSCQSMFSR